MPGPGAAYWQRSGAVRRSPPGPALRSSTSAEDPTAGTQRRPLARMALSAPTTMNAPASAGTAALSETSASSTRTTSAASTFSTVGAMARPQRGGLLVEVVPVRLPWASPAEHAPNERHGRIRHVAEGQDGRSGPVSLDGETDEEPPDHVPKRDRSDVAPGTPGFGTSSTEGTRAMLPPLWPPGTRSWENLGFAEPATGTYSSSC